MAQLSVSVALATCNGAKYLPEQLSTIAAQTLKPAELVVCDDASSDGTLAILQQFAAVAPFPVHIHSNPERLGYRGNFMRCASLCTSDLIAFCDQDDRWRPEKLGSIIPRFADDDVLLVFHDAVVSVSNATLAGTIYSRIARAVRWTPMSIFPWMFSLGFTQVFRRSLCSFDDLWPLSQDQNEEHERLAHDQWFFFLSSVLGSIEFVPNALVDYRQHGANVYGWTRLAPARHRRVLKQMGDASRTMGRRQRAALSRAEILERIAARADEPDRRRAARGIEAYQSLGERYRLRASLYSGAGFGKRCAILAGLLRSGAYGKGIWQIGWRGFAMDLIVGLFGLSPKAAASSPKPVKDFHGAA